MLLDQKRTKRTVQIVAILTSLAFAGVIFVVLGLILFGGGGATVEDEQLDDAKARVETEPRNPDAWEQLAAAHAAKDEFDEAISAAVRATSLAPRDFRRLQTLVSLHVRQGNTDGAIETLQGFTAKNPRNADAFLQLGQLAETAGRTPLARLSFQTFLRLAPDDPSAELVRERLDEMQSAPS